MVGFNDLEGSDQMLPSLTTVRTPRAEIGRQAAAMMRAVLGGHTLSAPGIDLGFELVEREST
jgi:LacI family gluconate utilization system Gnt-I transcriptional repressor